jgi:hypothetical protein
MCHFPEGLIIFRTRKIRHQLHRPLFILLHALDLRLRWNQCRFLQSCTSQRTLRRNQRQLPSHHRPQEEIPRIESASVSRWKRRPRRRRQHQVQDHREFLLTLFRTRFRKSSFAARICRTSSGVREFCTLSC